MQNPFYMTFIFNPLFNPDAKKPPNGAITPANIVRIYTSIANSDVFTFPNNSENKGILIGLLIKMFGNSHFKNLKGIRVISVCGQYNV